MSPANQNRLMGVFFFFVVVSVQFGYGVFLSVPLFAIVILGYFIRPKVTSPVFLVPVFVLLLNFIFSLSVFPGWDVNWEREFRLALQLSVFIYLLSSTENEKLKKSILGVRWLYVMMVILAFAIAQVVGLAVGKNIFVPDFLYINSQDAALAYTWTNFSSENSLDIDIRPSSFYSEPSYMGLVFAVLQYAALCQETSARRRFVISLIGVLGSAVGQTGLGLAANVVVAAMFRLSSLGILSISLLCSLALSLFLAGNGVVGGESRLTALLSNQDESGNIRLVQPAKLVSNSLEKFPLGIPISAAVLHYQNEGVVPREGDLPFQNGLFNLIIGFGWGGVAMLIAMLLLCRSGIERVLVLILISQNGAYAEVDKLVLLLIIVASTSVRSTLGYRGYSRGLYDAKSYKAQW